MRLVHHTPGKSLVAKVRLELYFCAVSSTLNRLIMAQALTVYGLTSGWSFRQTDDPSEDAWLPVARVPTNVHLDLIDHEKYALYMWESAIIPRGIG